MFVCVKKGREEKETEAIKEAEEEKKRRTGPSGKGRHPPFAFFPFPRPLSLSLSLSTPPPPQGTSGVPHTALVSLSLIMSSSEGDFLRERPSGAEAVGGGA